MSTHPSRRIIKFIFGLGLAVAAVWLILNRQAVFDWIRLSQYRPSAAIKQLADNDTLIGRGRDLFYVSDPQVQGSGVFNESCNSQGEKTIVLGCYKMQRIYLYNVTDSRLDGVKEVTAAHEMLHAVYERLSNTERDRVDGMLKPIIDSMKDQRILDLIRLYNEQEPGQLYNEMHSILGTEYTTLSPELETYYKQYFSDRSKVVGYANEYQGPFTESQKRVDAYDERLSAMKIEIDQNNKDLQDQKAALVVANEHLNQLRTSNLDAYNQAVSPFNEKVDAFNALLEKTKSIINDYNAIVAKIDAEAAAQKNLYQSLNSKYDSANQQ